MFSPQTDPAPTVGSRQSDRHVGPGRALLQIAQPAPAPQPLGDQRHQELAD